MNIVQDKRASLYFSFSVIIGVIWTLLIGFFCFWSVKNVYSHTRELSLNQARAFFQEIVTTRLWNAEHGGVYVPVTKETQPNPYLDIGDRIIKTVDGKVLTKINKIIKKFFISGYSYKCFVYLVHFIYLNLRLDNEIHKFAKLLVLLDEVYLIIKNNISTSIYKSYKHNYLYKVQFLFINTHIRKKKLAL